MKKLSFRRSVLIGPFAIAIGLVMCTDLPSTWSQNQGQQGAWPATGSYASSSGLVITGQSSAAASQKHLMSSATLSNGMQQIVLVDPDRQTIAVYHIDPDKGDTQLKSVRKIDADFALEEFNLSEPTPTTIRKNLRLGER
ncbi:MAG: hypothetical protein ACK6A7_00230 [Planctomycetota bacterium]